MSTQQVKVHVVSHVIMLMLYIRVEASKNPNSPPCSVLRNQKSLIKFSLSYSMYIFQINGFLNHPCSLSL